MYVLLNLLCHTFASYTNFRTNKTTTCRLRKTVKNRICEINELFIFKMLNSNTVIHNFRLDRFH